MRLILASASPRRAELLRAAGFVFETLAVEVDESVRAGETPAQYVRRLAAEKSAAAAASVSLVVSAFRRTNDDPPADGPAEAGRHQCQDVIVLAADTAVVVDGDIFGKPRDDAEAEAMLRRLSGRRHDVLTGVSVRRGPVELGRVESTAVYVAPLGEAEVRSYVLSGEGRDKAGAYAIQGLASRFIPRIDGSYSNVVGLPVACVQALLVELGVGNPAPERR